MWLVIRADHGLPLRSDLTSDNLIGSRKVRNDPAARAVDSPLPAYRVTRLSDQVSDR